MSTSGLRASLTLPQDTNEAIDIPSLPGGSVTDAGERALASLAAAYRRSGTAVDRAELYRAIQRFGLDAELAARLDTQATSLGYISQEVVCDEDPDSLEHTAGDASVDLLDALYADIKRTPFQDHAQQMRSLRIIRAGRMAERALTSDAAEAIDRIRLEQIASDGRSALDEFTTSNMRLVIKVARQFHREGLDLLDVIQEGADGLLRAVELFDEDKGLHFSTYAHHWIRQRIDRAYANLSLAIRLPVHAYQTASKALRARSLLYNRFGREPTLNEIAEHIGQEPELLAVLWQARFVSSLDGPINEGPDAVTLAEVLSTEINPVEAEVERTELRARIDRALGRLTPRESNILRLRAGYCNGRQFTLEEIGKKYGLTRERIRQIEAGARRKLRASKDVRELWRTFKT